VAKVLQEYAKILFPQSFNFSQHLLLILLTDESLESNFWASVEP